MIRQLPIVPTLLVVAAAGVMVWLGFWQLGRAEEKAALIAEFQEAQASNEVIEVSWVGQGQRLAYRSVKLDCSNPGEWKAVAGRSANGQTGYAHRFKCNQSVTMLTHPYDYVSVPVADIGWSRSPAKPDFAGDIVIGTLVTLGDGFKVVASEPLAGLQPLAKPDPNDLPNNHLAYAGQWFFFALTALVIYFFAVRSKLKRRD